MAKIEFFSYGFEIGLVVMDKGVGVLEFHYDLRVLVA